MKFFYFLVLALALFCGVAGAFQGDWIVVFGSTVLIGFFILFPETLD